MIEYGEILRRNRPLNPQLFHKVNASLNNEQSQRLLKFQYIFYLLIYRILAQNGSFAPVPSTIKNTYSVADDTRVSDFLIAQDMGSTLLTLIGVRNYVFVTCLKSSPREMSPFPGVIKDPIKKILPRIQFRRQVNGESGPLCLTGTHAVRYSGLIER